MADGDPDGWRTTVQFLPGHEAQIEGPFSCARRHQGTWLTPQGRAQFVEGRCGIVRVEEQDWHGDNCLVTWMDYRAFLATPAARGIPKPNWPACPRLVDTVSCKDAKAYLGASDADMCAWTLNRSLAAYQESSGRLERFEWPNAKPDDERDAPWRDQLAVLRFSRAELERFRPDSELRYLTCEEAIDRIQRAVTGMTREREDDDEDEDEDDEHPPSSPATFDRHLTTKTKKALQRCKALFYLVPERGFEPPTC